MNKSVVLVPGTIILFISVIYNYEFLSNKETIQVSGNIFGLIRHVRYPTTSFKFDLCFGMMLGYFYGLTLSYLRVFIFFWLRPFLPILLFIWSLASLYNCYSNYMDRKYVKMNIL
jgi:hypothetical protein